MLSVKEEIISDSDEHSSDEWMECTPPNLEKTAKKTKYDSLPSKSRKMYECTYDAFVKWKREHKKKMTSESVLMAYFNDLSKKYKPSTLWSIYSMLKSTLKVNEKIDIDTYHEFKAFMKKQSLGFTSKKSNVLSSENVEKFLFEAPDNEYLATKVALIFGIAGACRSNELVSIRLKDITKQGRLLIVNLPIGRSKKPRTFIISEEFTKIVQQYADLRPTNTTADRFFLNFQKGKCTSQVIGIHKFSRMPKEIAVYLKLDNPASFTGHAFRRTSATFLADSGANIITLKRHGGWKSNTVVKGYIEDSNKNPSKIGNLISTAVNIASAVSASERNIDAPPPEREKVETITSEKTNSNEQSKMEKTSPLTNIKFIFQNCTVYINEKEMVK